MLWRTYDMARYELWRSQWNDTYYRSRLYWKWLLPERWNCKWYAFLLCLWSIQNGCANCATLWKDPKPKLSPIDVVTINRSDAEWSKVLLHTSGTIGVYCRWEGMSWLRSEKPCCYFVSEIERLYQNADAQEYSKISDEIFQLFKRFSRSNDDYVHLGFLAVIDQLVDLGYQEEDRNVRISQYLETMIQETHSTMLLIPLSSVTPLC